MMAGLQYEQGVPVPARQWTSRFPGRSARSRQQTQPERSCGRGTRVGCANTIAVRSCCAETCLLTLRNYLRRKSWEVAVE